MLSLDNIEKLVTLLLLDALVRGGGVGFDILLCSYSCVTWGMDELDTADGVLCRILLCDDVIWLFSDICVNGVPLLAVTELV